MTYLVVEQIGGGIIARVGQDSDGRLQFIKSQAGLADDVRLLLERIMSSAVHLRVHDTRESPEGVVEHRHLERPCPPDDPRYLAAVADVLTRGRVQIGGRPIRAYVELGA